MINEALATNQNATTMSVESVRADIMYKFDDVLVDRMLSEGVSVVGTDTLVVARSAGSEYDEMEPWSEAARRSLARWTKEDVE